MKKAQSNIATAVVQLTEQLRQLQELVAAREVQISKAVMELQKSEFDKSKVLELLS